MCWQIPRWSCTCRTGSVCEQRQLEGYAGRGNPDTAIPPTNNLESAILATLQPGAYTVILAGKDGGTGIGLVEVYDLDQQSDSMLANISTRGSVGTGDDVLIGGFILGPDGGASSTILVRAIGPSLAAAQVAGPLEDPEIELYDSNGASIAFNDNWKETQQTDIEAAQLAPADDRESAMKQPSSAPTPRSCAARSAAPASDWWKSTGCHRLLACEMGKAQRNGADGRKWEGPLCPDRLYAEVCPSGHKGPSHFQAAPARQKSVLDFRAKISRAPSPVRRRTRCRNRGRRSRCGFWNTRSGRCARQ